MNPLRRLLGGAALLGLAACSAPPPALPPSAAPEIATGLQRTQAGLFRRQAVAAAHPAAAEAGLEMLRAGGNAVDAAVAVQMVLALVEPQSSGLGGGAFLLLWDGRQVSAWDGRETAPAAADERLLLRPDGQPLPFVEAMVSGRAVGVPGAVRMLEAVHRAQGRLPWARLFEPAIRLAEQGFTVGPRLHAQLRADPALRRDALAAALYYRADGQPHPVGQVLRNPALAAVLRAIAAQGSAALHQGPVAADIVRRVHGHAAQPGRLSVDDLAGYQAQRREPLCADWRRWRVCGMPPPSSGQLAVMQILALLDHTAPGPDGGPQGPDALHRYTEAARLAFADRAQWVADPAFVPAPAGRWTSLLDDDYLRERAALIGPHRLDPVPPGRPRGAVLSAAPMPAQPEWGTTHASIVDAEGRMVSMTSSIEAQFGARLMSDGGTGLPGGFLLNNQLTDFAFAPADDQGRPVANRVQAGKRPRSSMCPTLVFDRATGAPVLALGSSGGATIVHHVARTLLALLDEGADAPAALARPHVVPIDGLLVLERGGFAPTVAEALRLRGHRVQEAELTSGVQLLMRTPSGWIGAADPRREGVVRGD
ncbi:MAG: gamma-glutamyltransferase family protein [Rubrivivax sp.]